MDHVLLIQKHIAAPLIAEMKSAITNFYGTSPLQSKDLAKIINDVFQDHWKHSNGAIIDINGGIY